MTAVGSDGAWLARRMDPTTCSLSSVADRSVSVYRVVLLVQCSDPGMVAVLHGDTVNHQILWPLQHQLVHVQRLVGPVKITQAQVADAAGQLRSIVNWERPHAT